MVKLFYMNQGSKGELGAVKYSEYDALFLCESSDKAKTGFIYHYQSKDSAPVMTIQVRDGGGRLLSETKDISKTAKSTRPLLATSLGTITIIFFHLKSGNAKTATTELEEAFLVMKSLMQENPDKKILWIGDFNRASDNMIKGLGLKEYYAGGGQATWDLDRVYASGKWDNGELKVEQKTTAAGDHGHVGLAIHLPKAMARTTFDI